MPVTVTLTYAQAMKVAAREYLYTLLRELHGNRSLAAQRAGLNRTYLQRLLSIHELGTLIESDRTRWRRSAVERKPKSKTKRSKRAGQVGNRVGGGRSARLESV